jgi:hypothetical protein
MDATHADAIATIAVKAKFIVTLIAASIHPALCAGKAIGDNTQNLTSGVLHYGFANAVADNPEHPAQSLGITGIKPPEQHKTLAHRQFLTSRLQQFINSGRHDLPPIRLQPAFVIGWQSVGHIMQGAYLEGG